MHTYLIAALLLIAAPLTHAAPEAAQEVQGAASAETQAQPSPTAEKKASAKVKTATWKLGTFEVLSPGAIQALPEGSYTEGYTARATATPEGDTPIGAGVFTVTFGAFAPVKDLPKQPKGFWYVKGSWRLVQNNTRTPAAARHSPELMQGTLIAQLPFDPTQGKGAWVASARLPAGVPYGEYRKVDGTLNVDEQQSGRLFLQMQ